MPVAIDIRSDMSGAIDKLKLHAGAVMTAAVRSMNRTTTTVRKASSDDLQEFYPGMKVGSLKARMRIVKATRNKPEARVVYRGGRISLMNNFGMHRRGRFGVYFSKLPWRIETPSGEQIPPGLLQTNAFINTLSASGRTTVFVRLGRSRFPIGVLLAPGIAKTVTEKNILKAMKAVGNDTFQKNFARELAYAKSRKDASS